MKHTGFKKFYFTQMIFRILDEIEEPEEVREGYGERSIVVINAIKGK